MQWEFLFCSPGGVPEVTIANERSAMIFLANDLVVSKKSNAQKWVEDIPPGHLVRLRGHGFRAHTAGVPLICLSRIGCYARAENPVFLPKTLKSLSDKYLQRPRNVQVLSVSNEG